MKLPVHLNALRALEASARHQSFSAAAKELHVTPAAVGQLVRTLENWVGTPLFLRSTKGKSRLVPSDVAEQALPDIRSGLELLALGLERLQIGASRQTLTLTVSPAFASKWLLPRIERFQGAWPEIDLRLDTSRKTLDFAVQRVDAGVRYGRGAWPGLLAEKLMEEEVFPVCSPRFLQSRHIDWPDDLLKETLIHDISLEGEVDFPSWDDWFRAANVGDVHVSRGMKINNSAAVLQAAMDGYGVALARGVMAEEDLLSGRLLRLFPQITHISRLAYYVVYRKEVSTLPHLVAFRDWLLHEATSRLKWTSD